MGPQYQIPLSLHSPFALIPAHSQLTPFSGLSDQTFTNFTSAKTISEKQPPKSRKGLIVYLDCLGYCHLVILYKSRSSKFLSLWAIQKSKECITFQTLPCNVTKLINAISVLRYITYSWEEWLLCMHASLFVTWTIYKTALGQLNRH